jgi:lipid II:glycine glycyltransferase (peptidoglycan interpeptide bridge formation enzyme)
MTKAASGTLHAAWRVAVDATTQSEWSNYLTLFRDANLYQTWPYAAAARGGARLSSLLVNDDDGPVAMALVRIVSLPLVRCGVAYVASGPLWRREDRHDDVSILARVANALREEYASRRGLLLRIAPCICSNGESTSARALTDMACRRNDRVRPYRTILVEVNAGEEIIRRNLHKSWRKHLKHAEAESIALRQGDDEVLLSDLCRLYEDLRRDKGFRGIDATGLVRAQRGLTQRERLVTIMAYQDGRPVAGHASCFLGEVGLSVLAATSPVAHMSGAAYLVWWRTLLAARERGCRAYDTGGVDPDANPGVYQFKAGLGGQECRHIGTFEAGRCWWLGAAVVEAHEVIVGGDLCTHRAHVGRVAEVVRGRQAEVWASRAINFRDATIYQAGAYTDVAAGRRARDALVVLGRDGPAAISVVRVIGVARGMPGVAMVAWGPLWQRRGRLRDDTAFQRAVCALRREYVDRRGLLLRVTPNIVVGEEGRAVEALREAGYRRVEDAPAYRTIRVDLTRDLAAIRKGLAQKWRNCLNRAERNGVRVDAGTDMALFTEFRRLYAEMWSRKRFRTGVEVAKFARVQERLPAEQKMLVLIGRDEEGALAGAVVSALGDTGIYLLGASSERGRALQSAYLVQWRAIELLKERGCAWYDLGGIDPEGNPGVYHFKAGLGGQECRHIGTFEAGRCWWLGAALRVRDTVRSARHVLRSVGTRLHGK